MSFPSSTGWRPRRNGGWIYPDIVDAGATGWTCLEFYTRRYGHSTVEEWGRRLQAGQIRRGNDVIGTETVLAAGDHLAYHRPGWTEPAAPRRFAVLHDDGDLLVVAKPAGLQVLPAAELLENTLLHAVREKYGPEPAPAHRLGRGTSGLMLFARSGPLRQGLATAFRDGGLRKTYRALVQGQHVPEKFEIDVPIGRVEYPVLGHVYAAVAAEGKPSRSIVRRLEVRSDLDVCLVEVEIPTGRPHQIRIHLAAAGHPLVGEPLYEIGGKPTRIPHEEGAARIPRPGDMGYHLHAARVELTHHVDDTAVDLYCRPPSALRRRHSATDIDRRA